MSMICFALAGGLAFTELPREAVRMGAEGEPVARRPYAEAIVRQMAKVTELAGEPYDIACLNPSNTLEDFEAVRDLRASLAEGELQEMEVEAEPPQEGVRKRWRKKTGVAPVRAPWVARALNRKASAKAPAAGENYFTIAARAVTLSKANTNTFPATKNRMAAVDDELIAADAYAGMDDKEKAALLAERTAAALGFEL